MVPSSVLPRALRLAVSLAFLLALFAHPAAATEKIFLNDEWRFRIDSKSEGESQTWFKSIPAGTEIVRVPHTWNIGKYEDHEGLAWYFRNVYLPALRPQERIELHFGATFYLSRVWVNGVEAGKHEGGHTEYFFDITKLVKE
jgi:beta-glucuronidase